MDLCKKNWPNLSTQAFRVTRTEGGSYNRVIRLEVDASKIKMPWYERHAKQILRQVCLRDGRKSKSRVREYVIRMPRFEHAWFEQEVSLLLFVGTTFVPAPKVKTFNLSTDNPLGSRFTVQPRAPGKSVEEVYLILNTAQRITFARDPGLAFKEMGKLRSPCPGTIDPDGIISGSSDIQILCLQCPPRNARRPDSSEPTACSAPMSVYGFIKSQLIRQLEYDISLHRGHLDP